MFNREGWLSAKARIRLLVGGIPVVAAGVTGYVFTDIGLPHRETLGALPPMLVLFALLLLAWLRPLLVHRRGQSEAVQFDEGLVIAGLLLLQPAALYLSLGLAVVAAQIRRRRSVKKSIYNISQTILALGIAVLVSRSIGGHLPREVTPRTALAALAGGIVFSLVSAAMVAMVLVVTKAASARQAFLENGDLRMQTLVFGSVFGLVGAVAASAQPWGLALLPLPFLILRYVMAAQFVARHDTDRVRGLFAATLKINDSMDEVNVRDSVLAAARDLLSCTATGIQRDPNGAVLAAQMGGGSELTWLTIQDRVGTEPFDRSDRQLLDALAAVGRSALAHARLYAQSRRHEEQLSAIMRSLAEGVVAFDETGKPVFVNPAAESLLGLSAEEISDCGTSLAAAESLAPLSAIARQCLRSGRPVHDDSGTFDRARGGSLAVSYNCTPITEHGAAVGAVLAFRDITDRIAAEQELAFSAFHDQLTCLPNRRLFLERLEHALRRSQRPGTVHAVLFADVDRFKLINDNLGHAAGDELLCEIAHRLAELMRPADTVARFGGDEFTVLLEDVDGPYTGRAMAERIQAAMRPPVQLHDGREIVATVSVGIATTSGQQLADDVLHNADVAMYEAKTLGIGSVHVYDAAAMQARSAQRLDIEADLRTALVDDQLEVFYQPLVDVVTGAVADVEALVRWRHPDGLRLPGEFIPVAEETGLILALGRQVLAKAAQQAEDWHMGGVAVGVAVNLSARQFCDPMLVAELYRALESSGLPPERLCLEITESLAMREVEETIQTLRRMKELGVRLAIDDFGTGYSSLSYLKRFPVDMVKIDQSFVREIHTSEVDRAIVEAIVRLCDTMGMVTVAEGVEGAHQLAMLRDVGCRLAQGYHLCRPRPAAEIGPLLERPAVPAQRRRGGGKVTHLYAG